MAVGSGAHRGGSERARAQVPLFAPDDLWDAEGPRVAGLRAEGGRGASVGAGRSLWRASREGERETKEGGEEGS